MLPLCIIKKIIPVLLSLGLIVGTFPPPIAAAQEQAPPPPSYTPQQPDNLASRSILIRFSLRSSPRPRSRIKFPTLLSGRTSTTISQAKLLPMASGRTTFFGISASRHCYRFLPSLT